VIIVFIVLTTNKIQGTFLVRPMRAVLYWLYPSFIESTMQFLLDYSDHCTPKWKLHPSGDHIVQIIATV